jgi:WD40 repeat protein
MRRSLLILAGIVALLVAMEFGNRDPITPPLRQFRGHTGILREVAFSPDSRLLATSSVDGTVKLWSVPELRLLRTLTHPAGVTSIAFSADGQWLVSGSYDRSVRLWNLNNGSLANTFSGHTGTVWTVAIHADRIASGGEDATVRLWRMTGEPLHVLKGHERNVWSIAFSPDGQLLASGSFDHTVKLWRTDTGTLARTLTGHKQAIVGVAYGPDGTLIASGGDDSTARLWRAGDGALLHTLTGGSNHIYSVAFSGDGQLLASAGRERGALGTLWKQITGNHLRLRTAPTIRLWRVRDGSLERALAFHTSDVWSVAISPDSKWLASSSDDGSNALWDLTR